MLHNALAAVAAVAITFGTVSELNAAQPTPSADSYKVTIDKEGRYCVQTDATTGSRISHLECRTEKAWAKDGVTFQRAPEHK